MEEILEKIGLTKGEAEVYLALLEIGTSSTGRITKLSGISSSKVYEVLQRLGKKGLTSYFIENGVTKYCATPAKRLVDFLEEKKDKITDAQKEIKTIIPQLESKRLEHVEIPESIIYRGKKGPKIALLEMLELMKEGHEVLGYGSDVDDYAIFFPAQIKEATKEIKKHNLKIRMLFGEGYKSPNKNADIRFLPKRLVQPVRTIICENKVFIIDFATPMTTIVIDKKNIAEANRIQFEMLWDMAKK